MRLTNNSWLITSTALALFLVLVGCEASTGLQDADLSTETLGEPYTIRGFIPIEEIPDGADIHDLVKLYAASKTENGYETYEVGSYIYSGSEWTTGGVTYRKFRFSSWSEFKVDCSLFVGADFDSDLRELKWNWDVVVTNSYLSDSKSSSDCTSQTGSYIKAYDVDEKTYADPGTYQKVVIRTEHTFYMDPPSSSLSEVTYVEAPVTQLGVWFEITGT